MSTTAQHSSKILRKFKITNDSSKQVVHDGRRRVWRTAILLGMAATAVVFNFSSSQRRLDYRSEEGTDPVMYTFYSQISDVPLPAGMSLSDHNRLLEFWMESWTKAGWRPVVLNEADAKKHPDYEVLAPLIAQTGAGTYNKLCFLRWLALAQVGGGWMSDYDVFPLHDFRDDGFILPNNGNLTIHNGMCPSLVSGSSKEISRIAREMIVYAAEHRINSDQKTLVALVNEFPNMFEQDLSVSETVFNASNWNDTDCNERTPQSIRAVHFAHSPVKRALREGKLPMGWSVRFRPEVAAQFMQQWLARCGDRKRFIRDHRLLLEVGG